MNGELLGYTYSYTICVRWLFFRKHIEFKPMKDGRALDYRVLGLDDYSDVALCLMADSVECEMHFGTMWATKFDEEADAIRVKHDMLTSRDKYLQVEDIS